MRARHAAPILYSCSSWRDDSHTHTENTLRLMVAPLAPIPIFADAAIELWFRGSSLLGARMLW